MLLENSTQKIPYFNLGEVDNALRIKPTVEVRMATDSELSSVPGLLQAKEEAAYSALGLGSLGLGLIAPPLYASALVVGGVLVVAMSVPMGIISGSQGNTIMEVLKTEDFSALTKKAVIELLDYNETTKPNGYKLTILILTYGFIQKDSGHICFSIDAEIKLQVYGQEKYKDFIYIEPYLRSEDAPPPQCASVGEFTENKGKLAKETIKNFSVILASIVAHRLPALAWRKH